jgi:hypothetical protein
MKSPLLSQLMSFATYLVLQVLLVKNLNLFDTGFCFLYVSFLLLLPFELGKIQLLLLGFAVGFSVDVFYDTGGIHASACVLLALARPYVTSIIVPSGGYENSMKPWMSIMGPQWFVGYSLVLVTLHHLALFLIEAGSLEMLPFTLLKAAASIAFTETMVLIFQGLFYGK